MSAIIVESIVPCPLCGENSGPFYRDHKKKWLYERCGRCRLVFRDTLSFLSPEKEKARYLTHNNDSGQKGYVAFLSPVVEEISVRVAAGASGLDFGCGPGPVLAQLLRQAGYSMKTYDPFFAPEDGALSGRYDFVTCTETAEHFREPGKEFALMAALLKPGGCLIVMTRLLEEGGDFSGWWYRNDETHVSFYAEETLAWIAGRHGWRLERPRPSVALFFN